jgi:2-keto-4-pentenoate hydratase/2-oxohepta-3-ene-1,7-dioic acid hydratase in catechol pathway
MKLAFFNDFQLGTVTGDSVTDVSAAVSDVPRTGPHDLIANLIATFDTYRARLEAAAAQGPALPLASVRLRPPLPRPANIVCMAVNYMEDGTRAEPAPINAFQKASTTVIGPGDTMILPDMGATIFEGEAELALVIGKAAHNVPAASAMEHVFGYVCFIDGSARGVPAFYQMKSRATFAPIGPWIVTADEIPDPQKLQVRLSNNGTLMQNFNTDDMAHTIPRCIEWVTSVHRLLPGDILATGTNHRGLHAFQDGDRIELEIERVGKLGISVRDHLRRTWSRETRLQRTGKTPETAPQLSGKYAERR